MIQSGKSNKNSQKPTRGKQKIQESKSKKVVQKHLESHENITGKQAWTGNTKGNRRETDMNRQHKGQ